MRGCDRDGLAKLHRLDCRSIGLARYTGRVGLTRLQQEWTGKDVAGMERGGVPATSGQAGFQQHVGKATRWKGNTWKDNTSERQHVGKTTRRKGNTLERQHVGKATR
jgi:hypothetical protein